MLQKHQSTTVSFLLDSSGSMSSVHKETVEGVNDFINELKKDPSETFEYLGIWLSALYE